MKNPFDKFKTMARALEDGEYPNYSPNYSEIGIRWLRWSIMAFPAPQDIYDLSGFQQRYVSGRHIEPP